MVDRPQKTSFSLLFFFKSYLKIEREFGWKNSEKNLDLKRLPVLLLTNVFRDFSLEKSPYKN